MTKEASQGESIAGRVLAWQAAGLGSISLSTFWSDACVQRARRGEYPRAVMANLWHMCQLWHAKVLQLALGQVCNE